MNNIHVDTDQTDISEHTPSGNIIKLKVPLPAPTSLSVPAPLPGPVPLSVPLPGPISVPLPGAVPLHIPIQSAVKSDNESCNRNATTPIAYPPLTYPPRDYTNNISVNSSNSNSNSNTSITNIHIEDDIEKSVIDSQYSAEFNDGYTFRTLLEFFKVTNTQGNFLFTPDGITYAQQNPEASLLNIAEIYKWELPNYSYESTLNFIPQGINFVSIAGIIKAIRKKSSVKIYKLLGNNHIYVQLMGSSGTGSNNVSMIDPQKIKYEDIQVGEDEDETNPLCTVSMPEFAETCGGLGNVNGKYVSVLVYPNGMYLTGYTDTGKVGRVGKFGKIPNDFRTKSNTEYSGSNRFNIVSNDTDENGPKKMEIKTTHFKHISKLSNLSPSGTVKIHFYEIEGDKFTNRFLRLIFHVGTFGKLKTYLRYIVKE